VAQGEFFESIEDTAGSAEKHVCFDLAALKDIHGTGLRDIATPVIGRALPVLGQVPSTPQIAARKELVTPAKSKSSRHHSKDCSKRDKHRHRHAEQASKRVEGTGSSPVTKTPEATTPRWRPRRVNNLNESADSPRSP
jgi:hypothetical protein